MILKQNTLRFVYSRSLTLTLTLTLIECQSQCYDLEQSKTNEADNFCPPFNGQDRTSTPLITVSADHMALYEMFITLPLQLFILYYQLMLQPIIDR